MTKPELQKLLKRFPPEKKEEFLDYVLLTKTGLDLFAALINYIHASNIGHWDEAADVMVRNHPYYNSREWAAISLFLCRRVSLAWTKKVIEKSDHHPHAKNTAHHLHEGGHVTDEWYDMIVTRSHK